LKRLNTDYIDIYYLHWPDWNIPFSETIKTMEKLKKDGKIRMVGVSNFGKRDLREILKYCDVKINQLAYNLLFRAIEYEILPECIEKGVGLACYSPLAEALLTGKFATPDEVPIERARTRLFSKNRPQSRHNENGVEPETFVAIREIQKVAEALSVSISELSLSWLLHRKGISVVVVGSRKPYQIIQNAGASELKLSNDIMKKLDHVTENLKEKLGSNPDMWQTVPRIR